MTNLAQRVNAVLKAKNHNFRQLAEIAALDPKRHFRYSDWDNVDFSNTDLRDFDFTGASMRGCCFVGALVSRAEFTNAIVSKKALSMAGDWSPEVGERIDAMLRRNIGGKLAEYSGHTARIKGLLPFKSVDGAEQFISWGEDGTLRVWDYGTTTKPRATLRGDFSNVQYIPGRRQTARVLTWAKKPEIQLWDPETAKLEQSFVLRSNFKSGSIVGAMISTSRRHKPHVICWMDTGVLAIWDLATGNQIYCARIHTGKISACQFLSTKNGKPRLLTSSFDSTIRLANPFLDWGPLSPNSNPFLDREPHPPFYCDAAVNGVRFLPNEFGIPYVLAWDKAGSLYLWDIINGSNNKKIEMDSEATGATTILPHGAKHPIIVSWYTSGKLVWWNPMFGEMTIKHQASTSAIANVILIPNTEKLLTVPKVDFVAKIWNASDIVASPIDLPHDAIISGASILKNTQIVTWDIEGSLYFWEDSGELLYKIHSTERDPVITGNGKILSIAGNSIVLRSGVL